jgi:DNA-binding NtrC family response regulator
MKILILDDVVEYLNSLSRALGNDHEIVTAASLEEAKAKLDDTIQLAILDVRLAEDDIANRDGIQLLGYIRLQYPWLPVIMMSAYRDFDAATDALNLGASYYLKKPINLRELKDLITTLGGNPVN